MGNLIIPVAQRRCAVENSALPSGHRLSTENDYKNNIGKGKFPLAIPFQLVRGRRLLDHEDRALFPLGEKPAPQREYGGGNPYFLSDLPHQVGKFDGSFYPFGYKVNRLTLYPKIFFFSGHRPPPSFDCLVV